jgi:hypothetical protein
MKDQELILRFFALNYELDKYERPMADFLNGFSDRFRNPSVETKEKFNYLFRNTIALIFSELGAGAFRPEKLLNAAVFDGVMIGVARRLELGPIKSSGGIKERYEELIKDDGFRSAYLRSTADVESVRSRIKIASEYFKSVA